MSEKFDAISLSKKLLKVELLQKERWKLLENLSESELALVGEIVSEHVPREEAGDGVERSLEEIPAWRVSKKQRTHVEVWEMMKWQARQMRPSKAFPPFHDQLDTLGAVEQAVDLAIAALRELGIEYEGFRDTRLWRHPEDGKYYQVLSKEYAAWSETHPREPELSSELAMYVADAAGEELVRREFEKAGTPIPHIIRGDLVRSKVEFFPLAKPIRVFWQHGAFGDRTYVWHAINVLDLVDSLCPDWSPRRPLELSICHEEQFSDVLNEAILIGRSYQSMLFKKHEPDALRGKTVLSGAKKAALQRNEELIKQTAAVLGAMQERIERGHSIRRAADLTFQHGLGASSEANRKLWQRRTNKMGT